MQKYAYFSLVTEEFVPGIICLVKSLRRVTDIPIRILDLGISNISRWEIESLGAVCVQVKKITSAKAKRQAWHITPDFANVCYNKLHLWASGYDKVIYLDSDMLVVKNIDHLFEIDSEFAAVPTFVMKKGPSGEKEQAGWDDGYFNAGFFVLRPNIEVYDNLMLLKDTMVSHVCPLDTTDQSFLNEFYKDRWYKLGRGYNAYKRVYQLFRDLWDIMSDEIYAIHYNLDKPWQKKIEVCDGIEKIWWDYFTSRNCKGIESNEFTRNPVDVGRDQDANHVKNDATDVHG